MLQYASASQNNKPVKIAFISAGLGNISRGFEISSCTWFHEIKKEENIKPRLFSGGKYKSATKVWNFPRNGHVASLLRAFKLIGDGCRLEQLTFSFGFLIHLIFYTPHVIWLQEATLANMLLKFRKLFKFKYRVMFCDGAPIGHHFAKRFDYLIFLHQYAMNDAICDGVDPDRCCIIPHLSYAADSKLNKPKARNILKISNDKFVIICVAAWNMHHKRIHYLLNEIAAIHSTGVMLILCGQPEQETAHLKSEAARLRIDVQWHTLSQQELTIAYSASDLFVLPSLNEALGVVLIEAGIHGLPVICHPHQAGKFIFGENYSGLTNLAEQGNLSKKIDSLISSGAYKSEGLKTERIVSKRFDRQKLTGDFVSFIDHVFQN
jgi:glycosyltransferase involved in cell wall biosynthesis